jgi:hypothetical protein
MPTGYTAAVKDGISFEQFTWNCARAFGALILMRDEPTAATVPEAFKPSDFYAVRLAEAEDRLAVLKAMTPKEARTAARAAHREAAQRHAERLAEAQDLRNKYSEMLAKVVRWDPPTPEHQGLKDFMAEQLRQSIDFDCSTDYLTPPLLLDGATWLTESIADTEKQIKRYLEQHAEEVTRTDQRNSWIKALRESVPPPAA